MEHTHCFFVFYKIALNHIYKCLFLFHRHIGKRDDNDIFGTAVFRFYRRMEFTVNTKRARIKTSPEIVGVIYRLDVPKGKGEFDVDKNREKDENQGYQNVYRQVVIKGHSPLLKYISIVLHLCNRKIIIGRLHLFENISRISS